MTNDAYHLRKQSLRVPKTRTNYGKQKLTYQATVAMNKMSTNVNFNVPMKIFKKETNIYSTLVSVRITFSLLYA